MPSESFPPDSPVLVAESDPGGKAALRRILREFQFANVTVVDNAFKALHAGRSERFSLLLVSDTVEKGDGVQIVSSLRAEGKNRRAPIVFMHGEENAEAGARAASAGATAAIGKPLAAEALLELLEGVLDRYILTISRQKERDATPLGRGERLLREGDLGDAEAAFEEARAEEAVSVEALCGLAGVFLIRGEAGRAEEALAEAEGADPGAREKLGRWEKAILERGERALRAGGFEGARGAFAAASAVSAKSVEAHAGLAEALRGLGDAEGGRRAFETALSIGERPDDLHVYNRMGMAARRRGDNEGAVRAFDRALAFDPEDAVLHYNKSLVFIAQRRYREALELLKKALLLQPDFVEARTAGDTIIQSLKDAKK